MKALFIPELHQSSDLLVQNKVLSSGHEKVQPGEIKDPKIIEEILSDSEICRIAMMDGDKPYILPFNYGYKHKAIYIHCAREGKKIEHLKPKR